MFSGQIEIAKTEQVGTLPLDHVSFPNFQFHAERQLATARSVLGAHFPPRLLLQALRKERMNGSTAQFFDALKQVTISPTEFYQAIRDPFARRTQEFLSCRFPQLNQSFDRIKALILLSPEGFFDSRIPICSARSTLQESEEGAPRNAKRNDQRKYLETELRRGAKILERFRTKLHEDGNELWSDDLSSLYRMAMKTAFNSEDPQVIAKCYSRFLTMEVRLAVLNFLQDRESFLELQEQNSQNGVNAALRKLEKLIDIKLCKSTGVEILPWCINLTLGDSDYKELERNSGYQEGTTLGMNMTANSTSFEGRINTVNLDVPTFRRTRAHETEHTIQRSFLDSPHLLRELELNRLVADMQSSTKQQNYFERQDGLHLRFSNQLRLYNIERARGEIASYLVGGNFTEGLEGFHLGFFSTKEEIGDMRNAINAAKPLSERQKQSLIYYYDQSYKTIYQDVRILQCAVLMALRGHTEFGNSYHIASQLGSIDAGRGNFVRRAVRLLLPNETSDSLKGFLSETMAQCVHDMCLFDDIIAKLHSSADELTAGTKASVHGIIKPLSKLQKYFPETFNVHQENVMRAEDGAKRKDLHLLIENLQADAETTLLKSVRMWYPAEALLPYLRSGIHVGRFEVPSVSRALDAIEIMLRLSKDRPFDIDKSLSALESSLVQKYGNKSKLVKKIQSLSELNIRLRTIEQRD